MKYSFSFVTSLLINGSLVVSGQEMLNITGEAISHHNPTKKGETQFTSPDVKNLLDQGSGMNFTPNKGQIADMNGNLCPDVLYKGDGGGADIYLRKTGISYVYTNLSEIIHKVNEQAEASEKSATNTYGMANEEDTRQELLQKQILSIHRVDMDFAGCNNVIATSNENEADGYQNFYYAHCPNGITNVKQYNKVTFKNIYNNIDVNYYGGKQNGLKYDLIVQPHADPNQIKLLWKGAESIKINHEGKLTIKTSVNEFHESVPKVYQIIDGQIINVKARYVLNGTTVNFELGTWNPEYSLVIDPWATYYGGTSTDYGAAIATDNAGNVAITGNTSSANLPVLGGFQMALSGILDAFVVKFNSSGTRLWATFYGGTLNEEGHGIAADNAGNIIINGFTTSTNLPVLGGFQMVSGGGSDALVVKFNAAGTRVWASYYGGSGSEVGWGIEVDNSGNIAISGNTASTNFPVLAGFQMTLSGTSDAFLVKFNAAGTRIWATYYGGSTAENSYGVATDNSDNIIIAGTTNSTNFPVLSGFQMALSGVNNDAFVVKFNPAGTRLWATYYGGTSDEGSYGRGITTDNSDNVIIAGYTASANFPVFAGYQMAFGTGTWDAFLVKFNPAGTRQWATFYGTAVQELDGGIATDGNNNIYLLMEAEDVATPSLVDPCTYQPLFNAGSSTNPNGGLVEDQLIIKFSPSGNKICGTYMGGTGEDDMDWRGGISVSGGLLYITGSTDGGYPVTAGAFQTSVSAGRHAFVASLCTNICEGKALNLNYTANNTTTCNNTLVAFTPSVNNSCDTAGYKYLWTFTGGTPSSSTSIKPNIIYSSSGTYPVKLVVTTFCKKDSVIKPALITVNNCGCVMSAAASLNNNVSCSGANDGSAKVTIGSGSGGPYTYNWSNGVSGTTSATSFTVTGLLPNSYTVTVTEGTCSAISIVTITPQNTLNINTITATNLTACSGGNTGDATVTISSSLSGPYTYNWSNGASATTTSLSNTATGLSNGTYTVTITQGSCIATSTVTITQPLPLVIGISSQWSCITNKGTATTFPATGTSPYTYLWNSGQTTISATGLSLGNTYTVTVTDKNGCTSAISVTISILPMVITTASTNNGCSTIGSASVTITSGISPYSYVWNTGQTSSSINGLSSGGYSVTVTDGNGCTSVKSFTITGVNPVSAAFTNPQPCLGTSVTFTNTGSIGTYNWVISPITPTNVSGTTTDFSYTFLTAGTYTISHTVTSGGCTNTSTQTIMVGNCNGPTITATGGAICPGTCAIVTSNSTGGAIPYTYAWNTGATTQNINPCPTVTTTYTVTIKDTGGNTATSTAVVTVNAAITATTNTTNINCNGGTGSASAVESGGVSPYTYNWSNGGTTAVISNLSSQSYTVTITDSKGCTATTTANLVSPPPLAGQFTKGTGNCSGCGCKQWVLITGTGGTSPYSYSWTIPSGYINRYNNHLCPGTYSINITDKNGCSVNVNISAP